MTLTISNQQIEVKAVADFLAQMSDGKNDDGAYQRLIEASAEKQGWIEANFRLKQTLRSLPATLDVNLDEAFKIIEA